MEERPKNLDELMSRPAIARALSGLDIMSLADSGTQAEYLSSLIPDSEVADAYFLATQCTQGALFEPAVDLKYWRAVARLLLQRIRRGSGESRQAAMQRDMDGRTCQLED